MVIISSIWEQFSRENKLSYSISKAALSGLVKNVAYDLSKNNIDKEGVKLLATVMPHNDLLEVLDLSKNNIGVSGADALAKSLKNNKSLKYLNVFNNKIGYDGAKSIADNILTTHPKL